MHPVPKINDESQTGTSCTKLLDTKKSVIKLHTEIDDL